MQKLILTLFVLFQLLLPMQASIGKPDISLAITKPESVIAYKLDRKRIKGTYLEPSLLDHYKKLTGPVELTAEQRNKLSDFILLSLGYMKAVEFDEELVDKTVLSASGGIFTPLYAFILTGQNGRVVTALVGERSVSYSVTEPSGNKFGYSLIYKQELFDELIKSVFENSNK